MRTWAALILAPLAALAAQSIMYALVTPSCATQTRFGLHLAAAVALALAVGLALLAHGDWKRHDRQAGSFDNDGGDPHTARRFLAVVGTAVAALSGLVIVAMWFGTWILSPCSPWP
jgi:hypothetical protein